jgi:prepilin-type N-terminal cleavage/methylation domain-containing protein
MRLATGQPPTSNLLRVRAAFTLVELVVVMSIMVVVVAVAAPSFKAFLHGRNLEDEARRFLSLTRYGQSRAVSEGLPADLWMNVKTSQYGLATSGGYTETWTNPISFTLDSDVTMQVSASAALPTTRSNFWTPLIMGSRGLASVIHFQPDGFISDSSPQSIHFRQGTDPEIWVVENANHQRYDLNLNPPQNGRK